MPAVIRNDYSRAEVVALLNLPFADLMHQAGLVHRESFNANQVQVSTLLSIKTGGCPEFVYNGEFGSVLPVAGANVLVFALSRKGPLLMANAATIRATIKPISIPIPMLIAEPELRRGWLVLLVMKFPK